MARPLVFAWCAALLLPPSSVLADSPQPAAAGIRVRLTAPDLSEKPLIGTLTALEPDGLFLRPEGRLEPIKVPRTSVTKWEMSQGVHANTSKGAAWGFLGGAAFGAGVAASEGWESGYVLLAGAFYGAAGAGIGALIGALHKTERWQEIDERPFRINIVPVPDGVGISVAWSFGGGSSRPR